MEAASSLVSPSTVVFFSASGMGGGRARRGVRRRRIAARGVPLMDRDWGVLYTKKREKISKTRPPKTTKPRRPI